jgi:hypothetical protein
MFFNSESGQEWLKPLIREVPPPIDLGDYTSASAYFYLGQVSVIRDDYGNWYVSGGIGINSGGGAVSRGDVLINTKKQTNASLNDYLDIDAANLTEAEKSEAMKDALTGSSGSAGVTYGGGIAASENRQHPYHSTIEAVVGPPGVSYSPYTYSWLIWEAK